MSIPIHKSPIEPNRLVPLQIREEQKPEPPGMIEYEKGWPNGAMGAVGFFCGILLGGIAVLLILTGGKR